MIMSQNQDKNHQRNSYYKYLTWDSPPECVLVIRDDSNTDLSKFIEILTYLIIDHHLTVYVEEKDNEDIGSYISNNKNNYEYKHLSHKHLRVFIRDKRNRWTDRYQSSPVTTVESIVGNEIDEYDGTSIDGEPLNLEINIDFVICLGGDGVLLHASSLFQEFCPPVISLHSGLLGFLCPFSITDYQEYLGFVIKGDVPLLFRNRLRCIIKSRLPVSLSNGLLQETSQLSDYSDFQSMTSMESIQNSQMISLNEIVISRGPSSYICILELYVNNYLITTIQGDGIIISTPTGTTAYAMAAGASMSHPSLPAIIITPICPHSLSFRPIVVPAGVQLKIQLSAHAHNTAWYSVDGSPSKELLESESISITTSMNPLPSICRSDQINDWFEGLATCLNWNKRQHQLPLISCYFNFSVDCSSEEKNDKTEE